VACEPSHTVEASGRKVTVRDRRGSPTHELRGDPLEILEAMTRDAGFDLDASDGPLPVAIGYLGYDLGRTIERLPPGPQLGADLPDMWFGFYGAVLRFDGARGGEVSLVGRDAGARERLAAAIESGPRRLGVAPTLAALRSDDD